MARKYPGEKPTLHDETTAYYENELRKAQEKAFKEVAMGSDLTWHGETITAEHLALAILYRDFGAVPKYDRIAIAAMFLALSGF